MRRRPMLRGSLVALILAAAVMQPVRADFEVTDSRGRRITLKDDGTWRYVDAEDGSGGRKPASAQGTPEVQADLALTRRDDSPGGCRISVMLTNRLPYEIHSFVPTFAAHRADGVVYASKFVQFASLRPGNLQVRQMQFEGMSCQDIAKLRVLGGDRCEMGELGKFSAADGSCLALVRAVPSELLKFEK